MMQAARRTLAVMALSMSAWLSGCAAVGVVGDALPEFVPPAYELADRPTLVFVQVHDEAYSVFGSPGLRAIVAAKVAHDLKEKEIVNTFIEQIKIYELHAEVGEKFEKMAIDEIGRRVGAEQVIAVDIVSVVLRPHPGILEPAVRVQVRVIDAKRGIRVFPVDPSDPTDMDRLPPPVSIIVQMRKRLNDQIRQEEAAALMRILATQVGRDVGRLFYKWDRKNTKKFGPM